MKDHLIVLNSLPASAMAIFPFILVHRSSIPLGEKLLNHERIHLQQQLELLIIPFYIWYGLEYLFYILKFRNHHKAYRSIRFEKEAYSNEMNLNYLKNRKHYNYLLFSK